MVNLQRIPFIQAKWFTPVLETDPRRPVIIVLHCMEAPKKSSTAENVARYFESGCEGRKASAHYCIDNDSIVQCVQCKDVAFGAPGANRRGIHLEHAGYTHFNRQDWVDDYGMSMLKNSASLCSMLRKKFGIPNKWLSANDLRNTAKNDWKFGGITSHAECSRAFPPNAGHEDPGQGFPYSLFLGLIDQADRGVLR